jgi:hypothetical protein
MDALKTSGYLQRYEFQLLGIVCAIAYGAISYCAVSRAGYGELLWFCNIAVFLTGIGLFFKNKLIITAEFVGIVVYHIGWHIDFWSFLLFGKMPFLSTAYMFSNDVGTVEKGLSFFQHSFLAPVLFWALLKTGISKFGWIAQAIQTLIIFIATYFMTHPYQNINWIFGNGFSGLSPARNNPIVYYTMMAVVPPLLIYLPLNALSVKALPAIGGKVPRYAKFQHFPIILFTALLIVLSCFIALRCRFPEQNLKEVVKKPDKSYLGIEQLPVNGNSPAMVKAFYDSCQYEIPVPLHPIGCTLPVFFFGDDGNYVIAMKSLLSSIPLEGIPAAPESIKLKGIRKPKNAAIVGVVISNNIFIQHSCDTYFSSDTFSLECQIGIKGSDEFFNPVSGKPRELERDSHVVGGGIGGIYAVAAVALQSNRCIARSPFYLFKRVGCRLPSEKVVK